MFFIQHIFQNHSYFIKPMVFRVFCCHYFLKFQIACVCIKFPSGVWLISYVIKHPKSNKRKTLQNVEIFHVSFRSFSFYTSPVFMFSLMYFFTINFVTECMVVYFPISQSTQKTEQLLTN